FSPNRNGSTGKIRFGLFEADVHSAELRKNGKKVRLQDQPFQILVMLLEQPGEVVTRETLRASLWPVNTFVDFDHGLNAAAKRLRDALGDSAENPRFVETLARRGYRFIAPIQPVAPNGSSENPATTITKVEPIPAVPITRASLATPSPTGTATSSNARRSRIALSAAPLFRMGPGAGWVAARRFTPISTPLAELRLTANPPDDPILSAVISPDAKYLAFSDRSGLFLRFIATGET